MSEIEEIDRSKIKIRNYRKSDYEETLALMEEMKSLKERGVKSIGKWLYIQKKGFILREKPFFLEMEKMGISKVLLEYKGFLKK